MKGFISVTIILCIAFLVLGIIIGYVIAGEFKYPKEIEGFIDAIAGTTEPLWICDNLKENISVEIDGYNFELKTNGTKYHGRIPYTNITEVNGWTYENGTIVLVLWEYRHFIEDTGTQKRILSTCNHEICHNIYDLPDCGSEPRCERDGRILPNEETFCGSYEIKFSHNTCYKLLNWMKGRGICYRKGLS